MENRDRAEALILQGERHLLQSGSLVAPKDECQGIKGIDTRSVFISGWKDDSRDFNRRQD